MNQPKQVTGMVLLATPVGEYDKRVVILTKEQGKLAAFARGARRPNNQLSGVTLPCSFGTFVIYEGKNSNTIESAHITHYFSEIREDVDAACYAFYFLEFADYYTKEGNDERQMLGLLFQTMKILTKGSIKRRLIQCIYELKAFAVNGEAPQVFSCVCCGSKDATEKFSVQKRGMVCDACSKQAYDVMKLNKSTVYAMQYVISAPLEKLYTFTLSDEVLDEFEKAIERYREIYTDKRFKSLEILKVMTRKLAEM